MAAFQLAITVQLPELVDKSSIDETLSTNSYTWSDGRLFSCVDMREVSPLNDRCIWFKVCAVNASYARARATKIHT